MVRYMRGIPDSVAQLTSLPPAKVKPVCKRLYNPRLAHKVSNINWPFEFDLKVESIYSNVSHPILVALRA
jgi:hypothetical protein